MVCDPKGLVDLDDGSADGAPNPPPPLLLLLPLLL
jgi:hypothetical protein